MNFFRKAGCTFPTVTVDEDQTAVITDNDESASTGSRNVWDFIANQLDLPSDQTFLNYVHCDENLDTDESRLSESEIVAYVTTDDKADEPGGETEDEIVVHDTVETVPVCTGSQAIQYIRSVREYCLQKSVDGLELLNDLEQLITEKIMSDAQARKQSKITDFMSKRCSCTWNVIKKLPPKNAKSESAALFGRLIFVIIKRVQNLLYNHCVVNCVTFCKYCVVVLLVLDEVSSQPRYNGLPL